MVPHSYGREVRVFEHALHGNVTELAFRIPRDLPV